MPGSLKISHGLDRACALVAQLCAGGTDLIYPPNCPYCRTTSGIPCACVRELGLLRASPACPRCAASTGPHLAANGRCGLCRTERWRTAAVARAGPYTGPLRSAVRRLKFEADNAFEEPVIDWMTEAVDAAPWRSLIDVVVPVPAHWLSPWVERPVLARTLGRGVARHVRRPCRAWVRRNRWDPRQTELNYAQRRNNVIGSFVIHHRAAVAGLNVLVVDDVMTSGTTMNEVARVLMDAGARRVFAVVVARGGPGAVIS